MPQFKENQLKLQSLAAIARGGRSAVYNPKKRINVLFIKDSQIDPIKEMRRNSNLKMDS